MQNTPPIRKLLAIRFSALGDIAMTIPVIESLSQAYPNLDITLLSVGATARIYEPIISRCHIKAVNIKKDYRGIKGLNRLFRELQAEQYDAVADLHNVLRTKWLTMRFKMAGIPVAVIDKGRKEKKQLVKHTLSQQLTSSVERYRLVFEQLGFNFNIDYHPQFDQATHNYIRTLQTDNGPRQTWSEDDRLIGIAPFAQHRGKIYPLDKMVDVVRLLLQEHPKNTIFLFGSPDESDQLEAWTSLSERVINMAGKQTLSDDVRLIAHLDVMISMDSANMHLASLVHTPVVSIWGATHPHAGFLGFGQDPANVVQLPLPCRPCSIYGNKPCAKGTFECMNIAPEIIVEKVSSLLTHKK